MLNLKKIVDFSMQPDNHTSNTDKLNFKKGN